MMHARSLTRRDCAERIGRFKRRLERLAENILELPPQNAPGGLHLARHPLGGFVGETSHGTFRSFDVLLGGPFRRRLDLGDGGLGPFRR
ncbi:MAG: hypothetical protein QM767_11450 [Anaeromyxobacter sp.]